MTTRKFTDPIKIPFLNESMDKEKWLRVQWVKRHTEGLKRAATLKREPKGYTSHDIKKSVIEAGMATMSRANAEGAKNRIKPPPKDTDLVKLDQMREHQPAMMPVPDDLKKLINKNRREEYLKRRHLLPPDKKYHFIECTSWMYGWQFDQSANKLRGADYGKKYYVTRMKGLGPQPDPPHYCDCVEIANLCIDYV